MPSKRQAVCSYLFIFGHDHDPLEKLIHGISQRSEFLKGQGIILQADPFEGFLADGKEGSVKLMFDGTFKKLGIYRPREHGNGKC